MFKKIVVILLLALVLRLFVVNQSLWLDEAIGALVVKNQSYRQIVTQFPKSDNHPPLYYMTLKAWTDIFGYSELALRSLSILFGVMIVMITYLIASELVKKKSEGAGKGKKNIPIFVALVLATSPFHIYYSQEARMYIMAGFFAALAIYAYIKTEKFSQKKLYWYWILFSFSITTLVFTDYVPVFLLPVFWVYGLNKKKNWKWWKPFVLSHIPLVVLGLMWLPTFTYQSERGRWLLETLPAWKQVAGGATMKQVLLVWIKFVLGRISFLNKYLYYLLILISSIPFIVTLRKAWNQRKKILILWLWFFVPLILGFIVSIVFPAFIYFRFVYVVPAFYLLVVWGIERVSARNTKLLLLGAVLSVNLVGLFFYLADPNQQREQWKQAVAFIESKSNKNDVVLFENPEPFAPYQWYQLGTVSAYGSLDSISANREPTIKKTQSLIEGKEGIYYFEYLHDLHDPRGYLISTVKSSGFEEKEVFDDFAGIGQITYFKR